LVSVYEKCVELLDKYYDGDLPLKDQGKIVDIISEKFSRSKVKNYLLDEAKAAWNSKKVKGPNEDKEDFLEAYEEKYKIPLLKSRVKDLIKEFPIFCRLEHFFIRYLEVSRNDMKLIVIMDNETLVFVQKYAENPLQEFRGDNGIQKPYYLPEHLAVGKLKLTPESLQKSRTNFSISIWMSLLPPVLGMDFKEKEVSHFIIYYILTFIF
jgi:hypothetical protein